MATAVESTTPDIDDVLAGLEPVIGYRCWKVFNNELYPPIHSNTAWNPGLVQSGCAYTLDGQVCTDEHCRCGLYAIGEQYQGQFRDHYFDLETGQINTCHVYNASGGIILGAVLLFDTKIIPGNGFVCGRYSVITGFYEPQSDYQNMNEEATTKLAERYSVSVVNSAESLRQTASDHRLMQQWNQSTSLV